MSSILRFAFVLFFIFFSLNIFAQREYEYGSVPKKGVRLVYESFDTDDVSPGPSGRSVIWNFTTIRRDSQKIIKKILRPDSLSKAEFPEANFIEIMGDSVFTAMKEEYGRVYRMGFFDKQKNIKVEYPKPLLISRFPISYTDVVSRDFEVIFNQKDKKFTGKGEVKIEADAYGKLRLPDTTYNNVMRLRIVQKQTDLIEKYDVKRKTNIITYVWFDENHKNPILILKRIQYGDKEKKEGLLFKKSYGDRRFGTEIQYISY